MCILVLRRDRLLGGDGMGWGGATDGDERLTNSDGDDFCVRDLDDCVT